MLSRPGNDLLSQVLRHSTIGARAFDGRVRDGIGSDRSAEGHQAGERQGIAKHFLQRAAAHQRGRSFELVDCVGQDRHNRSCFDYWLSNLLAARF